MSKLGKVAETFLTLGTNGLDEEGRVHLIYVSKL